MNGSKRSFNSKNTGVFNGKLKDSLSTSLASSSSSNRHNKSLETRILEADLANIPLIKQADNAKFLPKYTAIASKCENKGVSMGDLDQLQQEFEKLLNTCALRIRHLLGENTLDSVITVKRRRLDVPRLMDLKSIRDTKRQCVPTKYYNMFSEVPKVALPRNDHSDKFWASIEPYCASVTNDDVAFLDRLIQECSKEINSKIPEIDEHYASTWSEEIINDEQNLAKSPNKKSSNVDLKKHSIQALLDTFSTPITHRLLAASIEEHLPKVSELDGSESNGVKLNKLKSSDFTKLRQSTNQKIGICLEEKLKKELVEQGIFKIEDVKNGPEDEILSEIKKCQQELETVNAYNIEELTKLKSIVLNDIHCNELKLDLEKVDRQVLELYNKIISQQEGVGLDREPNSNETLSELEQQADARLKQQIVLNREIYSLGDMSLLY